MVGQSKQVQSLGHIDVSLAEGLLIELEGLLRSRYSLGILAGLYQVPRLLQELPGLSQGR
jgi:hypothetical protein